jgi:hypothetical protein
MRMQFRIFSLLILIAVIALFVKACAHYLNREYVLICSHEMEGDCEALIWCDAFWEGGANFYYEFKVDGSTAVPKTAFLFTSKIDKDDFEFVEPSTGQVFGIRYSRGEKQWLLLHDLESNEIWPLRKRDYDANERVKKELLDRLGMPSAE